MHFQSMYYYLLLKSLFITLSHSSSVSNLPSCLCVFPKTSILEPSDLWLQLKFSKTKQKWQQKHSKPNTCRKKRSYYYILYNYIIILFLYLHSPNKIKGQYQGIHGNSDYAEKENRFSSIWIDHKIFDIWCYRHVRALSFPLFQNLNVKHVSYLMKDIITQSVRAWSAA